MKNQDLEKEPKKKTKSEEKSDLRIDEVSNEDVAEDDVTEEEEPVKRVSALFSFIVYFVSYMIGFVAFLITKHRIAIPFVGMLPAIFLFPYSIFGKRKRQWGVFFGIYEGFNIILLFRLLSLILKYMKDID